MATRRKFVDPREIGIPHEDVVKEHLKDPEYRKHYMRFKVRFEIAVAIKSLREGQGLTQKQLAAKSGVPQPQIARLEGVDDERIPSLELLVKIFSALNSQACLKILPTGRLKAEQREIVLV